MAFRKIEAGLVHADVDEFIGKQGTIFYDNGLGDFRISDGVTPGGIALSFGGGGGGTYTLPTATTTVKGGVKIDGSTITINNQVISVGTVPYSNLAGAPTIPSNTNQLTNGAGYITSGALSGYATESYVTGRGYITSSALTGYATQSYVTSQGYITSSALTGYALTSSIPTDISQLTDIQGLLGQGGGGGGTTYITNNVENPYAFSIAGDDSTLREIANGESIKFTGAGGITIATDDEGNVTITGNGSGGSDRLVAGDKSVILDTSGTVTFPDATVQHTAWTGTTLSISDTAPTDKDFWYNTTDGRLYVKDDDVWVDANPQITPDTFSGDYNDLTNLPTLVTSYTDLTDLPTLVTSYNQLTDLPTLFSGSWNDLTDVPDIVSFDSTPPGTGVFWFNTDDSRLYVKDDDVWVDANPQITQQIPTDISDLTDDLGLLQQGGGVSSWNDLTDKPTIPNLGKFVFDSDGDSAFITTTDDAGASPDRYDIVLVPNGEGYASIRVPNHTNTLAGDPVRISNMYENGSVAIETNSGNFTFNSNGKLTFPNGSTIGDSDAVFGVPITTTRGSILIGNQAECIGGENHFHIMKAGQQAIDLFLGDDNNYVKLPSTGGVEISSSELGAQHYWTFGTDGTLTVPFDSGIISPGAVAIQTGGYYLYNQTGVNSLTISGAVEITYAGLDSEVSVGDNITDGNNYTYQILDITNTSGDVWSITTSWVSITPVLVGPYSFSKPGFAGGLWQFGKDAGLTFPDNTVQYTAWQGSTVVSDTAPEEALGRLWYNTTDGRTYVRYNDTWVDASPQIPQEIPEGFSGDYNDLINIPEATLADRLVAGSKSVILGTDGLITFPEIDGVKTLWGAVDEDFSIRTTRTDPGSDADIDIYAADDLRLYAEGDELQLYANRNVLIYTDTANTNYEWTFGDDGNLTIPGNIRKTTDASIVVGDSVVTFAVEEVDSSTIPPSGVWRLFFNDSDYPTLGTTVQIGDTVTTAWGTPITATIVDIQQDSGSWQIHVDQDITVGFNNFDTVTFSSVANRTWTFGTDGFLTFPNGDLTIGYNGASNVIEAAPGTLFTVLGSGPGGAVGFQWISDTTTSTTNAAAIILNSPFASNSGTVQIATGAVTGPVTEHTWEFGPDGDITFPDATVQTTAWTGTTLSVSSSAPTDKDFWYNTTDGRLYLKDNSIWVDASPQIPQQVPTDISDLTDLTGLLDNTGSGITFQYSRLQEGITGHPITSITGLNETGLSLTSNRWAQLMWVPDITTVTLNDIDDGGDTYNWAYTESGGFIVESKYQGTIKSWRFNRNGTTEFPNYTFPSADGAANQVLKTDGNGNLTWTDQGATPDRLTSNARSATLNSNGTFSLPTLTAAPADPQAGQMALADGVSWNPLSQTGTSPYMVIYTGTGWLGLGGGVTMDQVYGAILELGV